jgi:hypothetical protein
LERNKSRERINNYQKEEVFEFKFERAKNSKGRKNIRKIEASLSQIAKETKNIEIFSGFYKFENQSIPDFKQSFIKNRNPLAL